MMAQTKDAIKGSFGNMVFYRVKGKTRIRSVPLEYRDAANEVQRMARQRLMVAVRFYQRLKDSRLREVWRLAAEGTGMSGYNLFLKTNLHAFDGRTLFDPAGLLMAAGVLPPMNLPVVEEVAGDCVTVVWENSIVAGGVRSEDKMQVVALFGGRLFTPVWLEGVEAKRMERRADILLGQMPQGGVHLYCFFASPDGRAYSPCSHLYIHSNAWL